LVVVIAMLLISSIWITGCIGGGQINGQGSVLNNGQNNNQNEHSNNGMSGEQHGSQQNENQETNQESNQEQQGSINFDAMTIAELMASGKSIHCVGTATVEGKTERLDVYIKNGFYRYHGITVDDETVDVIVDENSGTVYGKVNPPIDMTDVPSVGKECDWISFKRAEASQAEQVSGDQNYEVDVNQRIDDVVGPNGEKVSWQCNIEDVPNSYFTPDGTVCSLEEIISAVSSQYGQYNNFH